MPPVQYLYRVHLIGGKYIKDTLNKVLTRALKKAKTGGALNAVITRHAQLKEILESHATAVRLELANLTASRTEFGIPTAIRIELATLTASRKE